MKIAFLTPEYVTSTNVDGGLANYLKKTAAALAMRGFDVSIFVVSNRDAVWLDGAVKIIEVSRASFLPSLLSHLSFLRTLIPLLTQIIGARKIAGKFWKEHANRPFDIIQVSNYLSPGYFLLNNKEVPVVCRISSYTPLWRSAYGRKTSFIDYIMDWLEIRQVRGADLSYSPSRFMANTYLERKSCHLDIIPTPLDWDIPRMDYTYFEKHRPKSRYLLYFGTLNRIKGVDLLADLLPGILEKYSDLSIVMIGRDDGFANGQKIFSYILEKCDTYRDRIYYHPAMKKKLLYPFVAHSEAVLMPSRVDNYPNACLEAQILGKLVIAFFDSSLEEMIEDGLTGFLAKHNDRNSLKNAISRCLDLKPDAKKIMEQNVFLKVEKIKKENRIKVLLDFYKKSISLFQDKHG